MTNIKKYKNKIIRYFLILMTIFILSLSLISCNSYSTNNINDLLINYQSILWQTSAERKAGLITQFNNAKRQFDQVINHPKNKTFLDLKSVTVKGEDVIYNHVSDNKFIPVVIMDLDETIVDNTPAEVYRALHFKPFDREIFYKWIKAEKAKIYPGALDFINYVWNSGAMVFFSSNRVQGDRKKDIKDELISTRSNLIKEGYPTAFLDSHIWWMKGSLEKSDLKETRFNHLNNLETKILPKTPEELGIKNVLDFNTKSSKTIQKEGLPVQIVMRVGDDINDFNDIFTRNKNLANKHEYLKDKDIENLFGNVSPRISFEKNPEGITKYYHEKDINYLVDDYLLKSNLIYKNEIKEIGIEPQETYALITGNTMYGGWLEKYAKNFEQVNEALKNYWKEVNWI